MSSAKVEVVDEKVADGTVALSAMPPGSFGIITASSEPRNVGHHVMMCRLPANESLIVLDLDFKDGEGEFWLFRPSFMSTTRARLYPHGTEFTVKLIAGA